MKKLILIAMFLGLTGCNGDDSSGSASPVINQSDISSPNPIQVASRSMTSSAMVGAFNPWATPYNAIAIGAGTLVESHKPNFMSSAVITVEPTEVAKVLRNGVAGVALSVAVDQLLDAVDWVLDPANNQILYRDPNATNPRNIPKAWCYDPGTSKLCFSSPNSAKGYYKTQYPEFPSEYIWKQYSDIHWYLVLRKNVDSTSGGVSVSFLNIDNPYYDPTIEDRKALSLETVAQKVIDNANGGSLDAQVATLAAAAQIIAEAEQDDVKAKPIVDELERNAKCPSGIMSEYGQCWVCSKESHPSIRGRVVYAKDVVGGLGKCTNFMNSSELLTRYKAYSELGIARDAENSCWAPPHQNHLQQAIDAKDVAAQCNEFLGLLGQ